MFEVSRFRALISPNFAAREYTMTLSESPTDTAKNIKRALKAQFPETKFSVRTLRKAEGATVDVQWLNGPTTPAVDAVVKGFEGSHVTRRMIFLATYEAIQAEVLASLNQERHRPGTLYPVPPIVLQYAPHYPSAQGDLHQFIRVIAENREHHEAPEMGGRKG